MLITLSYLKHLAANNDMSILREGSSYVLLSEEGTELCLCDDLQCLYHEILELVGMPAEVEA